MQTPLTAHEAFEDGLLRIQHSAFTEINIRGLDINHAVWTQKAVDRYWAAFFKPPTQPIDGGGIWSVDNRSGDSSYFNQLRSLHQSFNVPLMMGVIAIGVPPFALPMLALKLFPNNLDAVNQYTQDTFYNKDWPFGVFLPPPGGWAPNVQPGGTPSDWQQNVLPGGSSFIGSDHLGLPLLPANWLSLLPAPPKLSIDMPPPRRDTPPIVDQGSADEPVTSGDGITKPLLLTGVAALAVLAAWKVLR